MSLNAKPILNRLSHRLEKSESPLESVDLSRLSQSVLPALNPIQHHKLQPVHFQDKHGCAHQESSHRRLVSHLAFEQEHGLCHLRGDYETIYTQEHGGQ